MALAMIMVGGTTITIGWLGWPFTAILVLIVGQFVALGVAFPVMKWASNYEDARMERERAEWVAKIKAMKAAAKATTEDEEE